MVGYVWLTGPYITVTDRQTHKQTEL